MTPIDLIIKSALDSKGFQEATKFINEMGDAVKAGFGIAIGERILGTLKKIPDTLIDAAKEGVRFNATIEDQNKLFQTLLGNIDDAHTRVRELVEFSEQNPLFSFSEVAAADRQLQVLTKGALATAEGLKLVGDVSAATGQPIGAAAEMVGRFYGALDEGLPIQRSTMEMFRMGLISADTARHLEEVGRTGAGIGNAMEITQKTFARTSGAMGQQAETFNGQMRELKTNVDALARSMTGGLTDGVKTFVEELNKGLKEFNDDLNSEPLRSFLPIFGRSLGQSLLVGGSPIGMLAGEQAFAANNGAAGGAFSLGKLQGLAGMVNSPAGAAKVGPMPLTAEQSQMMDELEGKATEAHRSGLSDRAALETEYLQKIAEADKLYLHNFEAWQQAMTDIEDTFDVKRVLARAQADEEAEKNTRETQDREAQYRRELQQRAMQEDLDALRIKRDQISLQEAKLDAAFGQTELEKRGQRIQLIKEEIDAIEQLIKKLEAQREAESDPAARQSINQQITSLAGEKRAAQTKLVPFTDGASPTSFRQQWSKAIVELRDQWGTAAQQMATSFKDVFNSAIGTISSGITSLIMGTETWGQALTQIGMTILQTIIQAIVQMGVRWIATQLVMAIAGKSIQASMVAANAPLALASAAIWATPATLATIASYGAAAAAAPAFITAAEGITMASSLAMFKEGGYTGDGDPNAPAGIAHKGEFYFTAPQTKAIGPGKLATMAKMAGSGWSGGSMASAVGNAFGGGGGGGVTVKPSDTHVVVVNNQDELLKVLQSRAGQKIIVDTVSGAKLQLGIQT